MEHVGVLEDNPERSALTGCGLDALTIVTKRRVLGAMEPECNFGGQCESQGTTLADSRGPRYNQMGCIRFFYERP
jgi:hypothetical protein